MSAVENTTAPAVAEESKVAEIVPAVVEPTTTETEAADETKTDAAPAAEESKAEEAAPAEEKVVEPVTEGQLAYKGPGLVKSLIASKKEFWLSDSAVEAENLDLFLRGEKPEIAHPVVAWATQTGKGLLFFNKKGDTDRAHPSSILDLYNATDLKKESGHQFAFKLHGSAHTFKAANDAERDGWYLSIEKAIELSKASKEEIQSSEAYKAELEKLNKAQTPAVAAGAAKTRSQSQPKKSTEINRANSVSEEEDADKKKKSRSTSRGLFGRRKTEQKPADKEETTEEAKPEAEVAAAAVAIPAAAAGSVAVAESAAAPEEKATEPTAEATEPAETKAEETAKPAKRGSIFGKLSGWGSVKSPTKEKDQKEAELAPETPTIETPAAEAAPATSEPAEAETALPAVGEPSEPAKEEIITPTKEKSKFLSGLGFVKRGRSVSPSNVNKEAAKAEEAPVVPEITEPATKVEEPAVEAPVATETADKPAEDIKTETTPNKRQSILGSLGRRASKAFRGIQTPKQENAPPAAAESTKEETAPVEVGQEIKALEAETAQNHIGDVVPEAVSVGQPEHVTPVVTASA